MPGETVGREVVRGTICLDRYEADVALVAADRIPVGEPSALLVDIRWRGSGAEPPADGQDESKRPVVLTFATRGASASGDIRFSHAGGPLARGFAGSTRELVTIVGVTESTGDAADLTLEVRIDGEVRKRLPMSVGTPRVTVSIEAEDGGEPPASLAVGERVRLRAVPSPEGARGTFRWLCVPADAVAFSDPSAAVVEVVGGEEAGEKVTLCAAFDREGPDSWGLRVLQLLTGRRFGLVVQIERDGPRAPLANAWIYRRTAAGIAVLRTNALGVLMSAVGPSNVPSAYTSPVEVEGPATVELAFSRGGSPLPAELVAALPRAFFVRNVPKPPAQAAVALPDVALEIERPEDLALWPVSFECHTPAYSTSGLVQGSAAISGSNQVRQHEPPPAPAAAGHRPRERSLVVSGRAAAGATAVQVRLLRADGTAIGLRSTSTPDGPPATALAATLAAPSGAMRGYSVQFRLADAAPAFGLIRVVVTAEGAGQPAFAVATVLLCGVQIALVADPPATPALRGPLLGEDDELVEVDFQGMSPQRTMADLAPHVRTRRMAPYEIGTSRRVLDPTASTAPGNTAQLKPRMPLWMAELQLLGVTPELLTDIMARRFARARGVAGPPVSLKIVTSWRLTLSWDGPDANALALNLGERPALRFVSRFEARKAQTFEAFFGARGQLVDAAGAERTLDAAGALPGALTPAPTSIPFPVGGRRLEAAVLRGQRRPWGRQRGATEREAMLVEWQPRIVDERGTEIIRGGDGELQVSELSIDGHAIVEEPTPPPPPPPLNLPAFRVRGVNPTPDEAVQELVRAFVQMHFAAHGTEAHVQLLSQRCWEVTLIGMFKHESRGHFDTRPSARSQYKPGNVLLWVNGLESGMPFFGTPNGYGIGQIDNLTVPQRGPLGSGAPEPASAGATRGVSRDEGWSFAENIRIAVAHMMDTKARLALADIQRQLAVQHTPFMSDRHTKAVFQRQVVRRYNGGQEFTGNSGPTTGWTINPTGSRDRRRYPNFVLDPDRNNGAWIAYFSPDTGNVADPPADHAMITGGIAFTAANYGPGI